MAKKILIYIPCILLALFLVTIAGAWIEHKIPVSLPVLPGSYPVGRMICHWVDTARIDSTATTAGVKRELMVWIWYPAADRAVAKPPAPYLPPALKTKLADMQGFVMGSSPTDHYWYQVSGAYHFNFSDMALTKEKWLSRLAGATGSIGGRRGLEVTTGCLRTFFDVYLRGAPKNALDSLPILYPELKLPGIHFSADDTTNPVHHQ